MSKVYGAGTENYLQVKADMSLAAWNTLASHEVFTVTGLVRVKVLIECTATLTDVADLSLIQMGVEGATSSWIASTGAAGNAANTINISELWIDATPADTNAAISSAFFERIVDEVDIGYEITGAALTGGILVFHCWWESISANGNVVAGTGAVL